MPRPVSHGPGRLFRNPLRAPVGGIVRAGGGGTVAELLETRRCRNHPGSARLRETGFHPGCRRKVPLPHNLFFVTGRRRRRRLGWRVGEGSGQAARFRCLTPSCGCANTHFGGFVRDCESVATCSRRVRMSSAMAASRSSVEVVEPAGCRPPTEPDDPVSMPCSTCGRVAAKVGATVARTRSRSRWQSIDTQNLGSRSGMLIHGTSSDADP